MASHTGSATPEQIDTLLNFLDEHKDFARGRLRSVKGKVQAKKLWEELCNTLNSMGGSTKTIRQWQKVWFDTKHLAMIAAADSRRLASAAGGGPSSAPILSQWELKVHSIMGDGFGECQTGARVPAFDEINEPIPSTSSQGSQPSRFSQPLCLDLPMEVMEYVEPSQDNSQPRQLLQPASQLTASQESLGSTHSSQPTRLRRRQSAAGSDVRNRLFQFEEGRGERDTIRNTELAGIRAALLQMCGLIREYLDHRN